jgi:aryl-alcohol dehydrogenase-like predicted oxidoreductase
METRPLGPFAVSVIGLGCNNFGRRLDRAQTAVVVGAALEAGITLFDTADVYGDGASEEYLGAALGTRRDTVVVATKFGMDMPTGSGASAAWIERAVEDSLRRLGTDRIDLYQMHRPDPTTPIEETLDALGRLVAAGKVRAVGCSNVTAEGIEASLAASGTGARPAWVSVQNQYSLLHRQPEDDGVLQACTERGLRLLPFFPLASGMLTGKYHPGEPAPQGSRLAGLPPERSSRFLNDASLGAVSRLTAFAEERGHTLLELAFGYLLSSPAVPSVIAGATRPAQIAANTGARGWRMTADEVTEARRLAA